MEEGRPGGEFLDIIDRLTIGAYTTRVTDETAPLRREIEQSRPFPSLAAAAAVALLRTADHVRHRVAVLLAPYDLSPQQYNVLRILRGARGEALPTLEIAHRMIERAPGITRLLDRLERKGLVVRVRCHEDRRRVLCSVAPAGLALLAELDEPMQALDDVAMSGLAEPELRQLLVWLDRVRESSPLPAPEEE